MDMSLFEAAIYNKIVLRHEIASNDTIKRLYIAALLGNAGDLTRLLNENVDLLEDVLLTRADTPLHIAARLGHLNFVRLILIHKPSLAWELDQEGFTAMSLASENGHVAIIKELLACDPLLCKLKDRDGRTLLHCAASHGRLEILYQLLINYGDCVWEVTARGETALHLALKNNQQETFLVLMDWITQTNNERLLRWKDKASNRVLNLIDQSMNTHHHHHQEGTHELTLTDLDRLSGTGKTCHFFSFGGQERLFKQHHKVKEKRKQLGHWSDETCMKYPGIDRQEQQKHQMLTTALLIINLAIFLLVSSWTQSCQLDKKPRLDSMLFQFQAIFSLFGVVSATSVIILVLTGLKKHGRQRSILIVVSAYSTIISYGCAIVVVCCS